MQCGIKYELKYVKGIEVPVTPVILLGRSIHRAVENLYKGKNNLQVSDIEHIALEAVRQQYGEAKQSGLFINDNFTEKEIIDRIEKGTLKMISKYFNVRIKDTTPVMVEHEFLVNLKEEAPKYCADYDGSLDNVYVTGYIDFVDSDENIIDLKTALRKPQPDVADKSDQLTMYALAYRAETGLLPRRVILDYIVHDWMNNPDKVPQIITLQSTRTESDIQRFLMRLIRVIKGIQAGVFLPPDPTSWVCNYCIYKQLGY